MGRTPLSGGTAFRFLPAEVADMEKALDASSGATPARSIVEALADKFTNSAERSGQKQVQWKQVWNWFQNRRHAQKAKIDKLKSVGSGGETPPAAKSFPVAGPSTGKKPSDVPMDFEAKSARDGAWYDVSAFISKRTAENGEPEVRVRFAGFGSEEDEWVNIATAVRQRSLPCETTECIAVLPGDLILCFQEGSEQALYFDADILDVQRRRHDVRGCRCRFWVRYRHDQTEEVVPLRKVCRRPETEQRLQQAREAGASTSKLSNKDSAIEASTRTLNGTPNNIAAPQVPPATPATPITPVQPSTTYSATPLSGTSPNLYTSVQPSTATPAMLSSTHPPATFSPVATGHPISTLQGTPLVHGVCSSQGPGLPNAANSSTAQQPSTSISAPQQTTTSAHGTVVQQSSVSALPQQQTAPSNDVAEAIVHGAAQQQATPSTEVVQTSVPGPSEQEPTATTGVIEPSNLTQPMETVSNVSSNPATHQTGIPSAPHLDSSAEVTPIAADPSALPTETLNAVASKELVAGVGDQAPGVGGSSAPTTGQGSVIP